MDGRAALDIEQPEQLSAYLRRSGRIAADEQPRVRTLAGGVSNRTVLVERANGERWVLKQALAKLRVAVDWYSDPARIHREALGLRYLAQLAPPQTITPLVFEDREHHVLAMRAVPEPHRNWKSLLLGGTVVHDQVQQFGTLLGTIQRAASLAREQLAPLFADRSFFESLRLEPYYGYTATRVPQASPFLQALRATNEATSVTLVHGDYSPKNILVYRDRLVLLDHEVIHWGDPAFDLGFSLAHLLSKAHHVAGCRAAFAEAANVYWRAYEHARGEVAWAADLEPRAVRHTLGCLLARVDGRSPLEYLAPHERERQRAVVVAAMEQPPPSIPALIRSFVAALD